MTRRTVIWLPDAEAQLAETWLASDCQNDVTTASQMIDRRLAENAESIGVDLSEGLRRLDEQPLRVIYEILDDDMMVCIASVRLVTSAL